MPSDPDLFRAAFCIVPIQAERALGFPVSTHLQEQCLNLQFWTTDYSVHSISSFLCVFNLLFYLANLHGILLIPISRRTVFISLANCICYARCG